MKENRVPGSLDYPSIQPSYSAVQGLVGFFGFLALLLLARQYSYLLFHSLSELGTVAIAFAIFLLAWNFRNIPGNSYLAVIGIGYSASGLLDLFHTLSHKGMNLFVSYTTNLPNQLWISARYLQIISFFWAILFFRKTVILYRAILVHILVVSVLLWLVFQGYFPDCYIEGQGFTPFKSWSEYILVGLAAALGLALYQRRASLQPRVYRLLLLSLVFFGLSELLFTPTIGAHQTVHMIGHMLKLASYYFVYRAIFVVGIHDPINTLFHSLREAQDRLLESYESVQDKVKERTLELEEKNKELNQLVRVISHDLQEPLLTIHTFSELLTERYNQNLDQTGKTSLFFLKDSSKRMSQMIHGLFEYSQIGQNPERTSVDCSRIVKMIQQDMAPVIKKTQATFQVESLPVLSGYKAELELLFGHLISNAIKFTQADTRPVIRISAEKRVNHWLFAIEDNGIGIKEKYQDQIFSMFKRLHTREEYEGTGIGLVHCKKIVELHGGKIWMESRPGKGSTFYFSILDEPKDSPTSNTTRG